MIIVGEQENRVYYGLQAWAGLGTRMYYKETVYSRELGSVENGRKQFVPPHLRSKSLSSSSIEDGGYCVQGCEVVTGAKKRATKFQTGRKNGRTGGGMDKRKG